MKHIGEKIKKVRKDADLKQSDLSIRTGITQGTISKIESGRVEWPKSQHLFKIAHVLGVSIDYLLGAGEQVNLLSDPEEDPFTTEYKRSVAPAFEDATVGMTLVDTHARHLMVNDILCDMLGYSREELLKKTVHDTTSPEDMDKSAQFIERTQRGEVTRATFLKSHIHKDGYRVPVRITSAAIFAPDGKPCCYLSRVEHAEENNSKIMKLPMIVGGE
jgi:PAS domain S-box-containing protein